VIGLKALQGSVVGGAARVALAVFVSPDVQGMNVRDLGAALGVSKSTAGNMRGAGAILARCGVAAADATVASETLALVAANQHKGLTGKSGAVLVKSIHTTYAAFRKAENTAPKRGAGKQTAAEKAAAEKARAEKDAAAVKKATNAQRIGGALLFLGAVVESGAADVTEEQVADLFTIVSALSAIVSTPTMDAETA
jgi:hypothetical protein